MSAIISARDRRTAVIGMAMVATLATAARGPSLVRRWVGERAAVGAVLRERFTVVRDARQHMTSLRDTLQRRRVRLAEWSQRFIRASAPAVGAAQLGAIVERKADDANVKIATVELQADSISRAGPAKIVARVSGEGDVIGLGGFLSSLEREDPIIVVRELRVTQTEPLGSGLRVEVLRFDLVLESLVLIDEGRSR